MHFKLLSIRDKLAGVFLAPFVARSDVDATRQIRDSLRDPNVAQTPVGQNPREFELNIIGMFDDETGVLTRLDRPIFVANLGDLLPKASPMED